MNLKAIAWLQEELIFWLKKGWITESSYRQIQNYYGNIAVKKSPSYTRVLILLLGLLLVGLGFFLLIVGYWNSFSPNGKMDWIFALALIAISTVGGVLWLTPPGSYFREGAGIFYYLSMLGSLFLMADTYPLGNSAGVYLLATLLLGAFAAYILESVYTMTLVFITIGLWSCTDSAYLVGVGWAWVMLLGTIPFFRIVLLDNRISVTKKMVLTWSLILGVYASLFFVLKDASSQLNTILLANISLGTYLLGKLISDLKLLTIPLRTVGLLGILYIVFAGTFRGTWQDNIVMNGSMIIPLLLVIITTVCTGFLVLMNYKKRHYKEVMEGTFPLAVILCSILSHAGISAIAITIIFDIYVFVVAAITTMIGVMNKNMGAINGAGAVVIIIVIARFFDPGFTFVERGISLLILGVILMVANTLYLWQKANRSKEMKRRVRRERRKILYGTEDGKEQVQGNAQKEETTSQVDMQATVPEKTSDESSEKSIPVESSEIDRMKHAVEVQNTLQEVGAKRRGNRDKQYASFTEMANDGLAHTWEVAKPNREEEKSLTSPWRGSHKEVDEDSKKGDKHE